MIDWIKDLYNNWFFRTRTLWEIKYPVDSNLVRNNINVGHHGNSVTIKSESEDFLHIIMLCSNYEKFNPDT